MFGLTPLLVLSLGSCAFATKHPAATAGIVAGTIAFSTCYMAVEKPDTCAKVGGAAGIGIGGVTWLATTFLETDAPDDPPDHAGGLQRVRGTGEPEGPYLPPEPNPLPATALPDAGVPMTPADAAPAPPPLDASSADAPAAP